MISAYELQEALRSSLCDIVGSTANSGSKHPTKIRLWEMNEGSWLTDLFGFLLIGHVCGILKGMYVVVRFNFAESGFVYLYVIQTLDSLK